MKSIIALATIIAISGTANATTIEDLAIHCQGVLQLEKVVETHFSPYQPPRGRAPEIPAQGWVTVVAKVEKLGSAGCELLKHKYHFDLSQSLSAQVSLPYSPQSKDDVEQVAKMLAGKKTLFQVKQSFGYMTEKKNLPLYPEIVSETLSLKGDLYLGGDKSFAVHVAMPLNDADVYHTTPVEKWSEEPKIKLVSRLANINSRAHGSHWLSDFDELFLSIEFATSAGKTHHMLKIWQLFRKISVSKNQQFFDFNVGGIGHFVGQPYAEKFLALANEVATTAQRTDMAFEYPTLFLANRYTGQECLMVTPEEFGGLLQQWASMYPSLLLTHQYHVSKIAQGLVSGDIFTYRCLQGYKTNENLALANELLSQIQ